MKKKIFLQLFLLLTIVIITTFVFKLYFSNKNNEVNILKLDINNPNLINSDLITNVEYISEGNNGSRYKINSKFAELNPEKENLIFMKEVTAVIDLKNSTPIKIYSKKAEYNKLTSDTKFYIDVLATYDQHSITSDTLELLLAKNLISIKENIFYKNLNTSLQADRVEVDIITKNSKIFMNNKSDKIEVINKFNGNN